MYRSQVFCTGCWAPKLHEKLWWCILNYPTRVSRYQNKIAATFFSDRWKVLGFSGATKDPPIGILPWKNHSVPKNLSLIIAFWKLFQNCYIHYFCMKARLFNTSMLCLGFHTYTTSSEQDFMIKMGFNWLVRVTPEIKFGELQIELVGGSNEFYFK